MKTLKLSCFFLTAFTTILLLPGRTEGRVPGSPEVFLWEVHIQACTLYIAGTVHIGRKDLYPPDETYLKYLERSGRIILEVPDDFEALEQKMLSYIQKDRLPEEKYFRNTLDSATIAGISEILGSDKFRKFDQYAAWVIMTQLSVNKMRLLDYDPKLAVDRYLRDRAVEAGKEVSGLEKAEDQFSLFEFDLPYEVQQKMIKHNVENLRTAAEQEDALYKAYYSNQLEEFGKIFTGRFDFENPNVKSAYNRIFAERNKAWADSLEMLANNCEGTVFVAVGAGHLFGVGNLLDCLKEKGYTVSPPEN